MRINRVTWSAILLVAAIGLLVIGGWYYMRSMRQSLWEHSVREIMEVTSQSGNAYDVYFRQEGEMLANLAANLSELPSSAPQSIFEFLPDSARPISCAVVDLKRHIAYSNRDHATLVLDEARLREFAKLGASGLLPPYKSIFTNKMLVGAYRRFNFADGVPGIIVQGQPPTAISAEFPVSFYGGEGFSIVVDREGHILIHPASLPTIWRPEHLFSLFASSSENSQAYELFRRQIGESERGVQILDHAGTPWVIAHVPVGLGTGWSVLSIVPDDVILAYAHAALRASEIFVALLSFALIIFCAFILTLLSHRTEVRRMDSEIRYREQLFKLLVNNTNHVFMMFNAGDCALAYASPNMERVLGITRQDAAKSLVALGVPGFRGSASCSEVAQAIPPGASLSEEGEQINAETGQSGWFVTTVYHEVIDKADRFIVMFSDRTREREHQAALEEALENARIANAAKTAFLDNMSHDMRTPMNAIVGSAALLERDAADPRRVEQYARKISGSSSYLLGMINDILDMGKIERGKTKLDLAEFDFAEIIEGLDSMIRSRATEKSQNFRISCRGIFAERLLGDRARITRILINILTNAVKYTQNGGEIALRGRQTQLEDGTIRLHFLVVDNGQGMSPEYVQKIFEPFTREHASLTNAVAGTGLGMAIVHRLLALMGGQILIRSRPGQGSAFLIRIDLEAIDEGNRDFWKKRGINRALILSQDTILAHQAAHTLEAAGLESIVANSEEEATELVHGDNAPNLALFMFTAENERAHLMRSIETLSERCLFFVCGEQNAHLGEILEEIDGVVPMPFFAGKLMRAIDSQKIAHKLPAVDSLDGRHVLIVDDNEMNLDILGDLLTIMGVSSDVATNGQECLDILANAPADAYDAVIMDVQMPVMNGHDATRAFRESSHPRAATLPIIAMTANSFPEDIREAEECGMNLHMSKPVDVKLLKKNLGELIARAEEEYGP